MQKSGTEFGFVGTPPVDVDQRVILSGVTWAQYEGLLQLFEDDQDRSEFLPDLDLVHIATMVELPDQARAVRSFRERLRG